MRCLKKISLAVALLVVGSQLAADVDVDTSKKDAESAGHGLRHYAEKSGRKVLTFVSKYPEITFIGVVFGVCLYKACKEEADTIKTEVYASYLKNMTRFC